MRPSLACRGVGERRAGYHGRVTQRSGFRAVRSLALAAVVWAGAVALVAGCSAEPEQTTQALRPLAAKEQAASIAQVGKEYRVSWTVLVANPNRWHFAENVVATIVGRDAQGREILRARQPVDAVPPGRTTAFSGMQPATSQPAKVEISVHSADWRKVSRIPSAFKRFPLTEVKTEKLQDGQFLVSGNVMDPFRKAAGTLTVTALLRDRDGRLAGGRAELLDNVGAGSWRRFVITIPKVAGTVDPARTEVYVTPWGSTAGPYEELVKSGTVPLHTDKPKTSPFPQDRGGEVSSFE